MTLGALITGMAVAILLLLGWLVPLISGIVRLRRKKRGGIPLTIIGGLWLLVAVGLVISSILIGRSFRDQYSPPTEFDPAQYNGPTSTITFAYAADCELTLYASDPKIPGGADVIICRSDRGAIVVPAGSHKLYNCEFTKTDLAGTTWSMSIRPADYETILNAPEGATVELSMGTDPTAEIAVTDKGGGNISLDLRITDYAGNHCSIRSRSAGGSAPGFNAIDKDGHVVWNANFAYG